MSSLKRPALGRGLSALIEGAEPPRAPAKRDHFPAAIEEVHPSPEQPRHRFAEEALEELAASIRAHGVIQPLIVRPRQAGGYFLIAGERRWRAAQRAGLSEVPVVVKDVTPAASFEMAMIENLQRQDLNAIEEAEGYQRMIADYGLTQEKLAERVGKDRTTVSNALRLLKLPELVRQMVVEGALQMGHARAILGLDNVAAMERIARTVVARGLSVRQTEALVKREREGAKPAPEPEKKSASVKDLELRLTRALGARTAVKAGRGGAGVVEIAYGSLDDLDRLLDRLLGQ
jgi:ParB family chromosome partitioning protein